MREVSLNEGASARLVAEASDSGAPRDRIGGTANDRMADGKRTCENLND